MFNNDFTKIELYMKKYEEVWYSQRGHRRQHQVHVHCILNN
jgi:hypothetical protein